MRKGEGRDYECECEYAPLDGSGGVFGMGWLLYGSWKRGRDVAGPCVLMAVTERGRESKRVGVRE